jgi:hypothetical protein
MKRRFIPAIFVCLAAFSGIFVFQSAAQQQGESTDGTAAQIKELQKERVETLERLVAMYLAHYDNGKIAFESLAAAQNELVYARLELTDKPEERIALWKKQLESAESMRKLAEMKFQNGATTQSDVCRAKALCLDFKIKLLREQGRLESQAKKNE